MKYELNHIYLADCYEAIKDIPDKSVDCIYTDVPYLIDNHGFGKSELGNRMKKKTQDLKGIDKGYDTAILNEFVRVMKKVNCFIWCSKLQIIELLNFFDKFNCRFEILVWKKDNPSPTCNNIWLPDLEYCLYFRERGVFLNDGYELKSKLYQSPTNKKDKDKFEHATIKPLTFVQRHIAHATQPNNIVLDPFMGSGTTAVACKNLGRQFIGFEINPKWHKIACDRLNNTDASGQLSLFTM